MSRFYRSKFRVWQVWALLFLAFVTGAEAMWAILAFVWNHGQGF
jgi:hypothetical protein